MKRVLVIGSGSIARRHIENLKTEFPGVFIVGMSARGQKISAKTLQVAAVVRTIDEALQIGISAAIIASPAPMHLTHAARIIDHGIPTLIEKPLCAELMEVQQWPQIETSPLALVGYNLRLLPAARVTKAIIDSEKLGCVLSVFAEVGNYLPSWRPGTDYRKGVTAQRQLGGGVLLELSHELDYLNWLFGDFHSLASSISNSKCLDVDVEDSVDVMMKTCSGSICHLHMNMLQKVATRTLQVKGSKGTLWWDLREHKVQIHCIQETAKILYHEPSFDINQTYINQLHALFELPRVTDTEIATVASSVEVMRLIEAMWNSENSSEWVIINEM